MDKSEGRRGKSLMVRAAQECKAISHIVLESHLTVWALGEAKGWCFRDDSALPLQNSRKSQVCPCRQPSLCHGWVFIGQCLESLALALRLTCRMSPTSSELTVRGAECHSKPLPLPPTRFRAFSAASSVWSDLPHQYFYHPLRGD